MLFYEKRNPIVFYTLYFAYQFNDRFLQNASLENWLWEALKLELFWIKGSCHLAGHCCRDIMLYYNGAPITTTAYFQIAVKLQPDYLHFEPVINESGEIERFNCLWLTEKNQCRNYPERPGFCRQYPASSFIKNSALRTDCGYAIVPTANLKQVSYPPLINRISQVNY